MPTSYRVFQQDKVLYTKNSTEQWAQATKDSTNKTKREIVCDTLVQKTYTENSLCMRYNKPSSVGTSTKFLFVTQNRGEYSQKVNHQY